MSNRRRHPAGGSGAQFPSGRRERLAAAKPGQRAAGHSETALTEHFAVRRDSEAIDNMDSMTQPIEIIGHGDNQAPPGAPDEVHIDSMSGPAPLPPSPAQRVQPPSMHRESIPDLGALASSSDLSSIRLYGAFSSLHGAGQLDEAPSSRWYDLQARPWLFHVLLGATCLAVGMVLGALLFGRPGLLGDRANTAESPPAASAGPR